MCDHRSRAVLAFLRSNCDPFLFGTGLFSASAISGTWASELKAKLFPGTTAQPFCLSGPAALDPNQRFWKFDEINLYETKIFSRLAGRYKWSLEYEPIFEFLSKCTYILSQRFEKGDYPKVNQSWSDGPRIVATNNLKMLQEFWVDALPADLTNTERHQQVVKRWIFQIHNFWFLPCPDKPLVTMTDEVKNPYKILKLFNEFCDHWKTVKHEYADWYKEVNEEKSKIQAVILDAYNIFRNIIKSEKDVNMTELKSISESLVEFQKEIERIFPEVSPSSAGGSGNDEWKQVLTQAITDISNESQNKLAQQQADFEEKYNEQKSEHENNIKVLINDLKTDVQQQETKVTSALTQVVVNLGAVYQETVQKIQEGYQDIGDKTAKVENAKKQLEIDQQAKIQNFSTKIQALQNSLSNCNLEKVNLENEKKNLVESHKKEKESNTKTIKKAIEQKKQELDKQFDKAIEETKKQQEHELMKKLKELEDVKKVYEQVSDQLKTTSGVNVTTQHFDTELKRIEQKVEIIRNNIESGNGGEGEGTKTGLLPLLKDVQAAVAAIQTSYENNEALGKIQSELGDGGLIKTTLKELKTKLETIDTTMKLSIEDKQLISQLKESMQKLDPTEISRNIIEKTKLSDITTQIQNLGEKLFGDSDKSDGKSTIGKMTENLEKLVNSVGADTSSKGSLHKKLDEIKVPASIPADLKSSIDDIKNTLTPLNNEKWSEQWEKVEKAVTELTKDDTWKNYLISIREIQGTVSKLNDGTELPENLKNQFDEILQKIKSSTEAAGKAKEAAEDAKGAAEVAKTAALGAKTAADGAKTAALGAKTAAEDAKGAALDAKTAADGAKTVALDAKTAALDAKTAAEGVKGAAGEVVAKVEKLDVGDWKTQIQKILEELGVGDAKKTQTKLASILEELKGSNPSSQTLRDMTKSILETTQKLNAPGGDLPDNLKNKLSEILQKSTEAVQKAEEAGTKFQSSFLSVDGKVDGVESKVDDVLQKIQLYAPAAASTTPSWYNLNLAPTAASSPHKSAAEAYLHRSDLETFTLPLSTFQDEAIQLLEDLGRFVGATARSTLRYQMVPVDHTHPRRRCAAEELRPWANATAAGEVPDRSLLLESHTAGQELLQLADILAETLDFRAHIRQLQMLLTGM